MARSQELHKCCFPTTALRPAGLPAAEVPAGESQLQQQLQPSGSAF